MTHTKMISHTLQLAVVNDDAVVVPDSGFSIELLVTKSNKLVTLSFPIFQIEKLGDNGSQASYLSTVGPPLPPGLRPSALITREYSGLAGSFATPYYIWVSPSGEIRYLLNGALIGQGRQIFPVTTVNYLVR